MNRVTIAGFFGRENLGDEWLLQTLMKQLRRTHGPDTEFTVLGFGPEAVEKHHGVESYHVNDRNQVARVIQKSHALVIGGGGLIHDRSNDPADLRSSSARGLALWYSLASTARACGTPAHLVGVGVDRIETERGRRMAAALFSIVHSIRVRDDDSAREALEVAPDAPVETTADIVFSDWAELAQYRHGGPGDRVVCVVRTTPVDTAASIHRTVSLLFEVYERFGLPTTLVTFQNARGYDEAVARSVEESLRGLIPLDRFDASELSPELLSVFADARMVIAARYHALALATLLDRPTFGLAYDPKVDHVMSQVGRLDQSFRSTVREPGEVDRIAKDLEDYWEDQNRDTRLRRVEALADTAWLNGAAFELGEPISQVSAKTSLRAPRADRPPRVLFVGGYWMKENDVVSLMRRALEDLPAVEVVEFNTDDHPEMIETHGRPYDRGFKGVCTLKASEFEPIVNSVDPDIVVLVAGGLALEPEHAARLRQKRYLVGISLSDPDVFPLSVKPIVRDFDLFFTNAYSSLADYRALGVDAGWLPFACYPFFHEPVEPNPKFRSTACLLGHARPDRVEFINRLSAHHDVKVYGTGWDQYGIQSMGTVNGREFLEAACSADMCLNFPRTMAGFTNVKVGVFETIGAGVPTVTGFFPEMARFFRYEEEVIGHVDPDDLVRQVDYYVEHPDHLAELRRRGFQRCVLEHNWYERWLDVLRAIRRFDQQQKRRRLSWDGNELGRFDFVPYLTNWRSKELLDPNGSSK